MDRNKKFLAAGVVLTSAANVLRHSNLLNENIACFLCGIGIACELFGLTLMFIKKRRYKAL